MSLPRWVEWGVRRVVPARFADDLVVDLEEGFERRRVARKGAWRWLASELARTPWRTLRREGRRMDGTTGGEAARGRSWRGWASLSSGLRLAFRTLARRPGYALVSVATLALSIGAATVVFSVLEGVLLRPLPYPSADRIHRVFGTNEAWRTAEQEVLRANWDGLDVSEDVVEALRGQGAFEAVGAHMAATLRLDDGGEPVELEGAFVLPGLFDVLGLAPLAGRFPSGDELAGGTPVIVIGERLWTSRYGRDASVLGRSVDVGGDPHTVVGVLPASFGIPSESSNWWATVPADFDEGRTNAAVFEPLVRGREGAGAGEVEAAVDEVFASLAADDAGYAGMGGRVSALTDEVVAEVEDGITLLFAAVLVIVLIASVNLANLVVARGSRRRSELAMRSALGATRADLIGSMLSEVALLCAIGGAIGVAAAVGLLDPFVRLLERATPGFPRVDGVGINVTVLAFSVGVGVVTALLAGLLPALGASRRSPWEALQGGRRSRGGGATRRTQRSLLLVESALAVTLLVVAGLLVRSAFEVSRLDPGYRAEAVAYLSVGFPEGAYETPPEAAALGRALETRLARVPGVRTTARTSSLPGVGGADGQLVWGAQSSVEEASLIWATAASPGYFDVMGIDVVEGRDFTDADGPDAEYVAVVSRLFAQQFFSDGESPVGATVKMGTGTRMAGGRVVAEGEQALRIVGVVDDVRQLAVVMEPDPMIYRPMAQTDGGDPHLVLRATGRPDAVLGAARAEVLGHDGGLLVREADVLGSTMRQLMAPLEVRMVLLLAMAGLAAVLTAVGIYGVVSYVVSDQLHEIGVRMALGARAVGESKRMVLQALAPVVVGAVLGLVAAWNASRLVESALFGVGRVDAWTYGGVFGLLCATAALAAWLPARRAARVDPVRVLTEE